MSTLTPIVFPEDHSSNHASSAFPYTSIDDLSVNRPGKDTNRMQQLESMLKEVQGRAEIVEKEAYDKAYLAGEKAGMVLGRKRAEQILEALQSTLQESETSLANMQQSFAEAAMDVAQHIAQNIVGDVIDNDSSKLLAIAQQAAAQLPDNTDLRIAVSPDDFFSFKRLFDTERSDGEQSDGKQSDGKQSDNEAAMIPLKRDVTVTSGTCRIMSSQQDVLIDPIAAVATYLNTLRPILLKTSPANSDDQQP